MTRHDLAAYPELLAKSLRERKSQYITSEEVELLTIIPKRLAVIQAHIIPQIYSGNCSIASVAYMSSMDSIRNLLNPFNNWDVITDPKSMPAGVARRLKALSLQADEIIIDKDELTTKLKLINDSHAAAENLPINLEDLTKAQAKILKANEDAATILGKIVEKNDKSTDELTELNKIGIEAKKLIALCEATYQITTTKGLAGAFEVRANSLTHSMSLWVVGLMLALGAGVYIASRTFQVMMTELANPNPKISIIIVNIIISMLSVGAPVWFSWLATKQIGQKFRLSEDYAYKASVAKAYEGYRKEAVRLDPAFESRLFSIALARLEEAPLRLVEKDSHGSPIHELINSFGFKSALDKFPDLNVMFRGIAEKIVDIGNITKIEPSVRTATELAETVSPALTKP